MGFGFFVGVFFFCFVVVSDLLFVIVIYYLYISMLVNNVVFYNFYKVMYDFKKN